MAPTSPTISHSGDSGAQSALSTVQPFISRNPAVFYAVVVLCSLSLACGAVYLSGAWLGAWKLKALGNPRRLTTSRATQIKLDGGAVNTDIRSRIKCLWLKLNGQDPRKHTRLHSPRADADPSATANWAARYISQCRNLDAYAAPIPTVQVGTTSAPVAARRVVSPSWIASPPPVAVPGHLVGLGFGTIPFTPCHVQPDGDTKGQTEASLPTESPRKTGEVDITENSYSIYSQSDSDQFSPYVPIYDSEDVQNNDTVLPIFVIESPSAMTPSPAVGMISTSEDSDSSLAYLKQDTIEDFPPHFALNIKQTLAYHNVPDVKVVPLQAHAGKQGVVVLSQADKENYILPV
ncbi:hypothetical protein EIP86_005769 [Pleurotus ostreatoroseus]|nr:hypothetical protein EIP86_005769 [Pleurotus ostreatoroseus]